MTDVCCLPRSADMKLGAGRRKKTDLASKAVNRIFPQPKKKRKESLLQALSFFLGEDLPHSFPVPIHSNLTGRELRKATCAFPRRTSRHGKAVVRAVRTSRQRNRSIVQASIDVEVIASRIIDR